MMSKTSIAGSTPTVCSAGIIGVLALLFASVFAPIESVRAASCRAHGADTVLTAPCGASVAVTSRSVVVAQAGGVPNLEFAQGCRDTAGGDTAILGRCMGDEQRARQKLTAEWEAFPHADRTQCTALARLGTVLQSYVELITCLEMAKEARALPKSAKE